MYTQAFLQERYQLKSILGQGGQATIFRALDRDLNVERAVKALSPEGIQNPNLRERFKAEAQVMAKLEHKGIVRVYDIVYREKLLFLVMEILAGGNLWQWVKANGKMPEKMACQALLEVGRALQLVHENGIVHRDIKPQNMLLNEKGEIKLTDFGIAQFHQETTSRTMTGLVMGTMGYMSPEQRDDSKQATALSDIYSLGACLYSLCRAQNPQALYTERNQQDLLKGFSTELQAIIGKACSHVPEERHSSAEEFCDALENTLPTLNPIPDSIHSLQHQARSMAEREDIPIDEDTMRSITEGLKLNKTNPTVFFETKVEHNASFDPHVPTVVNAHPSNETTDLQTTINTINKTHRLTLGLIVGLVLLIVSVAALLYVQALDQNETASTANAKQTCHAWAEELNSRQHKNGGFSGIQQVAPKPWDTGQQLTALTLASACGFSATETWKRAEPQLKQWLQTEDYPNHSLEASWMLIALAMQGHPLSEQALKALEAYELKDGSYGVYGKNEKRNAYATLLAAWALTKLGDDSQKDKLSKAIVNLKKFTEAPLSAGLDELAYWVIHKAGQQDPKLGPSKEASLALADRMLNRCKPKTEGGPCSIDIWPNSNISLPEQDGHSVPIMLLGEPWAIVAANHLQNEGLPEAITSQLKSIEEWAISQRISASPHILSGNGFEVAENIMALSLLKKDNSK